MVIKNITNNEWLRALCHEKPNSSYAQLFGYKEEGGKGTFTKKVDFRKFATEPTIANEFLSDFYNKITVQHVVSLFEKKPLTSKLGVFLRTYGKVGDIEEYVATKLKAVLTYAETGDDGKPVNPFEISKPEVVLSFIKTEDKNYTYVTLNYEQWYGAFINEGGLTRLASQILSELRDAIDIDLYAKITEDLADETKFTKSITVTTIADAGEEVNAKKAYEEIMFAREEMALPSTDGAKYNLGSLQNAGTPEVEFILFLNARYKASFDINVLASLFHSNQIKMDVVTLNFDGTKATTNKVIGVLMDKRAYVYGYRIDFTQSIMNPRNMFINTFHHRWIKRGVVPLYNAVRLTTGE